MQEQTICPSNPITGWLLPFTSHYRLITTRFSTVTFLQRTFTSLVYAHVGRTQVHAADLGKLSPFFVANKSLTHLNHRGKRYNYEKIKE